MGSRSKTGAPGAPLRMMESRWSEGEEEEWTQDLPLRSASSAWPPCPTSIVEVFRDLGHFLMLPQALQFYLGWKFSTDGFCALKTHHQQRGSAVPVPPGEQEEHRLPETPGWVLTVVTPLWHSQRRDFPALTMAPLTGHGHRVGQELAFLCAEKWLCKKKIITTRPFSRAPKVWVGKTIGSLLPLSPAHFGHRQEATGLGWLPAPCRPATLITAARPQH